MRHPVLVRFATTVLVAAGVAPSVGTVVAGASGPALASVKCTLMTGDPQIEAPSWAQAKGASSANDEWWCQLPHATAVPTGLVQRRRFFIPAEHTNYGDYWTWYGAPSKGAATRTAAPTPGEKGVVVADLVYSEATPPKRLIHQKLPKGKSVQIVRGVSGIESTSGSTVRVSFRYPTTAKGVPKYLTTVATVTVIGMQVPAATVLAVARQLKPL